MMTSLISFSLIQSADIVKQDQEMGGNEDMTLPLHTEDAI
jgi:hypothetical protein